MSPKPADGGGHVRARIAVGWLAVVLATMLSCAWAFWGIVENFHEGWYHPALLDNLAMALGQYLLPTVVFTAGALVAIRWPWIGGALYALAGLSAWWRFRAASPAVLYPFLVGPFILLGMLFAWGRPVPRKWALAMAGALPPLTLIVFGIEPAWRVAHRFDDGDLSVRYVQGNGIALIWAPAGPGWPEDGVSWHEAQHRCRHLTADGHDLAATPQDVWRLPTIDEAVRSLCRHGENATGAWDAASAKAVFGTTPDKESPLWRGDSKIIYWWTGSETDADHAFRLCYNGHVMALPKKARLGYLGFRAVRESVPIKAAD